METPFEGIQGPEGNRAPHVDGWILYSNRLSLRSPLNGKDKASPSLIFI